MKPSEVTFFKFGIHYAAQEDDTDMAQSCIHFTPSIW